MRDSKLEECQQATLDPPTIDRPNDIDVVQTGNFSKSVLDGLTTLLTQGDLQQVEARARNGDRLIVTSR